MVTTVTWDVRIYVWDLSKTSNLNLIYSLAWSNMIYFSRSFYLRKNKYIFLPHFTCEQINKMKFPTLEIFQAAQILKRKSILFFIDYSLCALNDCTRKIK